MQFKQKHKIINQLQIELEIALHLKRFKLLLK